MSEPRTFRWNTAWTWGLGLTAALRIGLGIVLGVTWWALRPVLAAYQPLLDQAYAGLPIPASPLGEALGTVWVRWDAVHLLNLARVGYRAAPPGDSVYYPLYPLVTRSVGLMLGNAWVAAGLLVSTLASVAVLALLYDLAAREFGEAAARWSVLAYAAYPMALFLMAPFTEALFLALTLGAFRLAYARRWGWAGVVGALAALTRGLGLWTVFALTWIAWCQWRIEGTTAERRLDRVRRLAAWAISLSLIPLGGFSFWLWRQWAGFGLSVPDSLSTYSSGLIFMNPVSGLWLAVQQWLAVHDFPTTVDVFSVLIFMAFWVVSAVTPRYRRGEWLIYLGLNLLFITSLHVVQASFLQSAGRYVFMLFPAFIMVGDWLARQGRPIRLAYFTVSSMLLILFSALYALWWFVG